MGWRLERLLLRQLSRRDRKPWLDVAGGAGLAAVAIGVRAVLAPLILGAMPFAAYFPMMLAASLFFGPRGGAACLAVSAGASLVLAPPIGLAPLEPRDALALLLFLAAGGLIVWLAAVLGQAMAEAVAAREQQRLLIAELQHRVKNTLTIVQAIAAQTLQASDDPREVKRAFDQRLTALAEAHNLLSASSWSPVQLAEVVSQATRPFSAGRAGAIVWDGDDTPLPAEHVVSLSLCLHELATNATKYGALSVETGRVSIRSRLVPDAGGHRLHLAWQEDGGPPVTEPTRSGFGSRLLKRGVADHARPKVEVEFAPSGFRWGAEFDVPPLRQKALAS